MTDKQREEKDRAELLPCPFCGGEPILNHIEPHTHHLMWEGKPIMPDHTGSWAIECCDAGMIKETREDVIAAWNRRSPVVSINKQMEEKTEQIRRAHAQAKPSAANPAWKNCHHDMTHLLAHIDALQAARRSQGREAEQQSEREEDEYVIQRLATILAEIAISFRGPELPRQRHSYHNLGKLAQEKMLEIDLLRQQVEELKAAQGREAPEWIRVKDHRFPKSGETVLTYSYSGQTKIRKFGKFTFPTHIHVVTHWMPLPPPPIAAAPVKGEEG